jgi:hypothetical protein
MESMEAKINVIRPAAGPETDMFEPLANPTIIPPTTPAIKPETTGTPDA